jgi:hypothetical protein
MRQEEIVTRHRTLFMTERSRFHQQFALDAAPPALDVVMLRPIFELCIDNRKQG